MAALPPWTRDVHTRGTEQGKGSRYDVALTQVKDIPIVKSNDLSELVHHHWQRLAVLEHITMSPGPKRIELPPSS
jgi:hypothetical protein